MKRAATVVCLVLGLAGCAALPRPAGPPGVVTGTVKSVKGQALDGLILFERGELHGNVWDRGLPVKDGAFRLEMPPGQYGLHLYASGYFYRPQAINVEPGQTLSLDLRLAPEPTRARDPVIQQVAFERAGPRTVIKMDVADPDGNLGPQVLAFNQQTGRPYAMAPPVKMTDLKANFPPGVYTLAVDGSAEAREWLFVVADHACFESDILSFPHRPQPARAVQ
jgi:hypothetical protein